MAGDLDDQLIEKTKGIEFGLQLDDPTDNNNDAHWYAMYCSLHCSPYSVRQWYDIKTILTCLKIDFQSTLIMGTNSTINILDGVNETHNGSVSF